MLNIWNKSDGFLDRILFISVMIICAASILFFLGLVVFGLGSAVNLIRLPDRVVLGEVSNVSFMPQHTENRAKLGIREVPDTWYLQVTIPGGNDWMSITHAPWDWQAQGNKVIVHYSITRLLGNISVDSIVPISDTDPKSQVILDGPEDY